MLIWTTFKPRFDLLPKGFGSVFNAIAGSLTSIVVVIREALRLRSAFLNRKSPANHPPEASLEENRKLVRTFIRNLATWPK